MAFSVLTIIPARSGSKGLRHKNVRRFLGEPLLVRAVELAKAAQTKRERWTVLVSTDSTHYRRLARAAGAWVPFLRPARLATDQARLTDVVIHALHYAENVHGPFDAVCMLSVTTPLTGVADLRRALRTFRAGGNEVSVAAVTAMARGASTRFLILNGCLDRIPRRQKVGRRQEDPQEYELSGAFYVASPRWLRRYGQFVRAGRTTPIILPRARSIDIESVGDHAWAEFLAQKQKRR